MKQDNSITVLYFSWVRERIGVAQETIETDAKTIEDFVAQLRTRGERYELAFKDMDVIRTAADQVLAPIETSLDGVREVAFFPPMTGG